jgi:hypothetical protein
MPISRASYTVGHLAEAFLAGPWTREDIIERGRAAYPEIRKTIRRFVYRLLRSFSENAPPSFPALVSYLLTDRWIFKHNCFMTPRGAAAQSWQVPVLTTSGQLADWLGVAPGRLDWLADVRGLTVKQTSPKLRNYIWRWQPRWHGRFRLIESPKHILKTLQRRILREILAEIPPHPAAHGFRPGRSIVSYAAPHSGQRIALRFDLHDFFPSIPAARVHALFRTVGYPDEVTRLLTGLCTSRMPLDVWDNRPEPRPQDVALGERLRSAHLPQGAPTSPALANLCAHRLDVRLAGLAESVGAVYTRYADDLAFSGGDQLARSARRFQVAVAVIAGGEGFQLHFQKSRFMRRAVCQQLAGVVVNERPNVRRAVYDEMKAILTNCARHGPQTQNRAAHPDFRGHLLGRIAHVRMIHPRRGAKLAELFARIAW